MIKAVLFDVDGVVLAGRHRYFSERYAEEYQVPLEKIMVFFKTDYGDCATGKKDIKEVLPKYLESWGWRGSVEDFLEYWFSGEKEVSAEILEVVKRLQDKNIICCLATNNETYRMEYLLNKVGLKKHFDRVYASAYIGFKKPTTEFFQYIFNDLHLPADEIVFWDSDEKVVAGAKEIGLPAKLYYNADSLTKELAEEGLI